MLLLDIDWTAGGDTAQTCFFLSVALQYVAPPAAFPHFISVH